LATDQAALRAKEGLLSSFREIEGFFAYDVVCEGEEGVELIREPVRGATP